MPHSIAGSAAALLRLRIIVGEKATGTCVLLAALTACEPADIVMSIVNRGHFYCGMTVAKCLIDNPVSLRYL